MTTLPLCHSISIQLFGLLGHLKDVPFVLLMQPSCGAYRFFDIPNNIIKGYGCQVAS